MKLFKEQLRSARAALLAVAVVALMPAVLEAAGMAFRNDTPNPIYVQGSATVNGQIKRGPLLYIRPGQTVWDVNLPTGNRTLTVYNASNQVMFQDTRPFQGKDMAFRVMQRGQPPRVEIEILPVPPSK